MQNIKKLIPSILAGVDVSRLLNNTRSAQLSLFTKSMTRISLDPGFRWSFYSPFLIALCGVEALWRRNPHRNWVMSAVDMDGFGVS